MSHSIRIPALAKVAARLEAMMDVARPFAEADDLRDVQLALNSLLLSCHDALDSLAAIGGRANLEDVALASAAASMDVLRDELAAQLPPVSGGGEDDPAEWPAWTEDWRWEPTPDEVLSLDAAAVERFQPSERDWADYRDWCDGRLTEADAIAAGLAV